VASAANIQYVAKLSGAHQVPKVDSNGVGKFEATLDTTSKLLTYTLTFDKLSGPATMAHVHGPASKTENAGVMLALGDKNPTSPLTGSVTLTDDQIKALQAGKMYVNVHTAANANGEIRGQIHRAPAQKPAAAKKSAS
jgi:hypothetical protein